MAENDPNSSIPETITRQALGRIAKIGDLYDITTEKFVGFSMLREQLPKESPAVAKTDHQQCNISVTNISTFSEKLDKLKIASDLKLSIVVGLCEVEGAAKFLTEKKTNFKSVESSLLYSITTEAEQLNLSNDDLISRLSKLNLSDTGATHVVVGIHGGANCAITMTDENSENKDRKEVEGRIGLQLEKLKKIISAAHSPGIVEYEDSDIESLSKFTLKFFADILPDTPNEIPLTWQGALAVVKKLPELLKNNNDGKGKPLSYALLPLANLPFGLPGTTREIAELEGGCVVKALQVFDHVAELRQKVHDNYDKLQSFSQHPSYYVTPSELAHVSSFENHFECVYASLQSEVRKLSIEIRSKNKDAESLEGLCKEYSARLKEKFDECNSFCQALQTRIAFVKLCKEYDVKCARLSISIQQQIVDASMYNKNVFILFEGEADREVVHDNRLAFMQLAKNSQEDDETVCYITWSKPTEGVRIEHYRKGNLFQADVAKELVEKDIAQSVAAGGLPGEAGGGLRDYFARNGRRGGREMEIELKVPCPGSYYAGCSKEGRTWTCIKCDQLLRFRRKSSEVFCSCGWYYLNELLFHCRSEVHGWEFVPFSDNVEKDLVKGLTWLPFNPGKKYFNAVYCVAVI